MQLRKTYTHHDFNLLGTNVYFGHVMRKIDIGSFHCFNVPSFRIKDQGYKNNTTSY